MGKRSEWKRLDELSAWDLDRGCRRIINQATPGRRRLKRVLRRQARKRLNSTIKDTEPNNNGGTP